MRTLLWLQMMTGLVFSGTAQKNFFHETLKATAHVFNVTNCWVCGQTPRAAPEGIPLYGLPFNISWLPLDDPWRISIVNRTMDSLTNPSCKNIPSNFGPEEYSIKLSRKAIGVLCVQRPSTNDLYSINMGNRSCDYVVTDHWNNISMVQVMGRGEVFNFKVDGYRIGGSAFKNDTHVCVAKDSALISCVNLSKNQTRADMFWQYWIHQTTCTPLPYQFYFICGLNAYKWLPPNWSGSCYIGHIVPKVRIVLNNPPGRVRNWKRSIGSSKIQDLPEGWDVTEGDRLAMIILPQYGVARAVQMMRRMSKIIEYAFNKTFDSIDALTEEVRQMRLVVLQNRAALDFILAAKGGVCALIGDECCSYISDSSENIESDLTEARKAVSKLHSISNDGIFAWLGQLGQQVVMYIAWFILLALGIFIIVKIIFVCISKCTTSTIEALPIRKSEDYVYDLSSL